MANSANAMHENVCMVTGATSGIGFVTAQALARDGATVIVVSRNPERGAATVGRIQARATSWLSVDGGCEPAIRVSSAAALVTTSPFGRRRRAQWFRGWGLGVSGWRR